MSGCAPSRTNELNSKPAFSTANQGPPPPQPGHDDAAEDDEAEDDDFDSSGSGSEDEDEPLYWHGADAEEIEDAVDPDRRPPLEALFREDDDDEKPQQQLSREVDVEESQQQSFRDLDDEDPEQRLFRQRRIGEPEPSPEALDAMMEVVVQRFSPGGA
ncbi:hypothetical protein diail_6531 [Diaporthe ilicicola]|nr:hypothetical protein diail_6531 [Diaporthe ilicicola]